MFRNTDVTYICSYIQILLEIAGIALSFAGGNYFSHDGFKRNCNCLFKAIHKGEHHHFVQRYP